MGQSQVSQVSTSPNLSMESHPGRRDSLQVTHTLMDNKTMIRYKESWDIQRDEPTPDVKRESETRSGSVTFFLGVPLDRNHQLLRLDLATI